MPSLPTNENKTERQNKLNGIRQKNKYKDIQGLAILENLPFPANIPSPGWLTLVARIVFKIQQNTIAVNQGNSTTVLGEGTIETDEISATLRTLDLDRIDRAVFNIGNYNNLFSGIVKLPEIAINQNFFNDSVFAWMRVAGPNPLVIEKITNLNGLKTRFPVTDEHYQHQPEMSGDSLAVACAEDRLFLTDYAVLPEGEAGQIKKRQIDTEQIDKKQKYLYAPLALFALPPATSTSRDLVPIAIQCGQDPETNPIITPDSGEWAWKIAKTIVQIADANHHELISHLGLTHLLIEPFAIATERQLAQDHPLGILLREHFKGTLLINDLAQKFLIGEDQPVDEVLAGTYKASLKLSANAIQNFQFDQNLLRHTFESRVVMDKSLAYPYRDDALMIWDAIHQWVSAYLSIYYTDDKTVHDDSELQNWVKEIGNEGRIKGVGKFGRINERAYLIDIATQIIFTASAQHAAVNFSQATLMSYAPAMPMAGYKSLSKIDFKNVVEQDFLDLLPPIKQAQGQLDLTLLLGSVYYTQLGNYGENSPVTSNTSPDKATFLQTSLKNFQTELLRIGQTIIDRNKAQPEKSYEFLIPSEIPQSINI
jgi:arachidonate 15-lipoxygenase